MWDSCFLSLSLSSHSRSILAVTRQLAAAARLCAVLCCLFSRRDDDLCKSRFEIRDAIRRSASLCLMNPVHERNAA